MDPKRDKDQRSGHPGKVGDLAEPAPKRDVLLVEAVAHYRAGRPADAVTLLRQAVALRPSDAEALNLLGVALDAIGDPAAGERAIAGALRLRDGASTRSNHAMVLSHLGRHAEAEAAARRALVLRPAYPEALNNLGVALEALRRPAEAQAAFRELLALRPGYAEGWSNLGNVLKALGRWAEASEAYEHVLTLNPVIVPEAAPDEGVQAIDAAASGGLSVERHGHRAHALIQLGRFEEAIAACERALTIKSDHIPALIHLGHALRSLGRLAEAESVERRAAALKPGDVDLLNNLAVTLEGQDRPWEALALLDLAAAMAPDHPETQHHRAMLLLRAGRFTEGWKSYESRMRIWQAGDRHTQFAGQTAWKGEPLEGRTLLIVPEQGFGDVIQFARYASLVAARGGRVVMGAQKSLTRLLQSLPDTQTVVAIGEKLPPYDIHVPLMSLPGVFGTDIGSIPAAVPYLRPEPEAAARWSERIEAGGTGLKVGIVWAGNPRHPNDRRRSLPFAALAPLWSVPGVHWFSLQVGSHAGRALERVVDLSPDLGDFAETAAALSALDLVITVDTAVAHLAGALARPVWVMLPTVPDWRWLRSGQTSPWYPTMRLFRQGPECAWRPVVEAIASALRARATLTP